MLNGGDYLVFRGYIRTPAAVALPNAPKRAVSTATAIFAIVFHFFIFYLLSFLNLHSSLLLFIVNGAVIVATTAVVARSAVTVAGTTVATRTVVAA